MERHKIISVVTVEGDTLYSGWNINMQVIVTDKGKYIDNVVGGFRDQGPNPGYNWADYVGKTVDGIEILKSRGYLWLKKR